MNRCFQFAVMLIMGMTAAGANPILPGFHADPEILYAEGTGKYYIYSTTDGQPGWGGWYYTVYSSDDLRDWTYEGVALDLKSDQVSWADGNAWAPAIEERKVDGKYRYYLYFSGNPVAGGGKQIGVAVADSPIGPFEDLGHPIITESPVGHGQQIDVDVFVDPQSGKPYLYWGNGYMAGAELNDDMLSIKESTITVMTPEGGTLADYNYREAPYVFYRDGLYYFLWSVDDTGSPNYHVAYGTSTSPLGPIKVADQPVVLIQNPDSKIYGPAHNSVIKAPETDVWYIVYHRINADYIEKDKGPGWHREVCIDPMRFNADGTIRPVVPSK
ncbi:MAG: family 43 glycosylhydrolase [Muribaculum sp.]|nr:family 43 glycosylhydrolase [Muribaculum sp.]